MAEERDGSAITPGIEPNRRERGASLVLVCAVASLGGFLFGFDTAVISGTVGQVKSLFQLTDLQQGWFAGSALVGCIFGALIAGALGDFFGRKPVLILSAALFFISALGSTIPPTFPILIVARIIGGFGVGIASVLAPMYISEFAPPKLRGRLVALYQLCIVIGILAAYFSNWLLEGISQSNPGAFGGKGMLHQILIGEVWRGMFGAEMIPAAAVWLLRFLVPESPRWLIKAGRFEHGLAILSRIRGLDAARQEVMEIQTAVDREEGTLSELFRPGLRTALMVGVGLSVFGQMTGVNIVIYYGPNILEEAGLALHGALQYQVLLGLINLVFTVLAMFLIDKLGRRPLLIGGMAAVSLSLGAAGVLFYAPQRTAILIVIVLGVYLACVAFSICAVIWVLTPEIFPNRVRGRAASIATFSNWGINTLTAWLFPWYVARCGMHAAFFTFAAICAVATVFFWRFVPETKGKSLEQIEQMWIQRKTRKE